jgi:hypothetical protein
MSEYNNWRTSQLCFRVHDEQSETFHSRQHGFTASHDDYFYHNQPMSQKRFEQHICQDENREFSHQSVQNHVAGWQSFRYPQETRFISLTDDLDWAIWEITRRLRTRLDEVQLSAIDESCPKHAPIFFRPLKRIRRLPLNPINQAARHFSKSSSEILVAGRIFQHCIVQTWTWTEYVSASQPLLLSLG